MDEILTYSDCVTYVEENGSKTTITALNKYKDTISAATRIQFFWTSVTDKSDRARCIRGTFHRISQDASKEGKCSRHFDARYRVT